MIFVAAALVIIGAVVALMGERAFRVILPIIGFVAGLLIGYSGVQAVFGIGVVSFPIAIITALLVGAIMAVLSYFYFDLVIILLVAIITSYGAMYMGIALGLQDNSFWLGLLAFAGGILGLAVAIMLPMSQSLVVVVSSFYGVAMVLAGLFLVGGSITADQLQSGIIPTVSERVHDQFIWLLIWFSASLAACYFPIAAINRNMMGGSGYTYEEVAKS
jgi:hypothetical protein